MNSKKLPLWLTFAPADGGAGGAGGPCTAVLFKAGDDLRQDQLILQIFGVMDALWAAEGLDMRMSAYRVVSTGACARARALLCPGAPRRPRP